MSVQQTSIYYSQDITQYKINKNDKLIVQNSINMYEPFRDYEYIDIPSSVTQSTRNHYAGIMEGGSGSEEDVFMFTAYGTFTMTIIQLKSRIIPHKITVIVKDVNKSNMCVLQ